MIASPLHKRELAWLASLAGAFAVFGLMFAYYMSFSDSEWSFVVFGRMLLTGEIRLFQEEIVGRRLPVPFYVLGLSQILVGPSLLAARACSPSWSAAHSVAAAPDCSPPRSSSRTRSSWASSPRRPTTR
ncbi:MAG: hypothetical protein DMD91_27060 [Candidatus Rokuibacteriota bacterium]|nr:MAG: hypothetical protein DMD91_27060 [Candidatus Rokubacteria bacterium]